MIDEILMVQVSKSSPKKENKLFGGWRWRNKSTGFRNFPTFAPSMSENTRKPCQILSSCHKSKITPLAYLDFTSTSGELLWIYITVGSGSNCWEDIKRRLNMILNSNFPGDPRIFNLQDFTTVWDLDKFQMQLLIRAFAAAKRTCSKDLEVGRGAEHPGRVQQNKGGFEGREIREHFWEHGSVPGLILLRYGIGLCSGH